MRRLALIITAFLAAGGIAAVPAIVGVAGNPSFSHQIPVRIPTQARPAQFVDNAADAVRTPVHTAPSQDRGASASRTRHVEPGDDNGARSSEAEVADDHSRSSTDRSGRHDRGRDDGSHNNHGGRR